MKEKVLQVLQKFSKAIINPVLYLPTIGVMLVICNIFINPNIIKYVPFLKDGSINILFKVLYDALMSIFSNLGPIFAIGIALGLAKKKKEQAALVSFMSLFIYLAAQNRYLGIKGDLVPVDSLYGSGQAMMLGFQIMDMGVFLGIIIGVIVGLVHNKFCEKDLGEVFSVYGGSRFVFLVCIPIMVGLAILNTYIWPPVQYLISEVSKIMLGTGAFGYFTFGFLERLLIPTGLHHLIGSSIWYTRLGGVATIGGKTFAGAWNIALAELADPTIPTLSKTVIFNNVNLVKIFGLTGAALAMIKCAKPENKKKAKALIIPAAVTSFIAGITEPIEFTFLFISPVLFLCHSVLTGIFFALLYLLNITCVSLGGIVETLLYSVPIGMAKCEWPQYIALGLVQLVVYYFFFRWFIQKFNVKTPGREDDADEMKLFTKEDYKKKQSADEASTVKEENNELGGIILKALGGIDNIISIDNCFTRLRVELKDMSLIDEATLKLNKAKGVVKNGSEVQVIYGVNVGKYRKLLEDKIESIKTESVN